MARRSIILVNTGDGEGKSSAASGVMSRGAARGWTVGVVQFPKSGTWRVGEKSAPRTTVRNWTKVRQAPACPD